MKKLLIILSIISIFAKAQEPEVDKIYIRENAIFNGESFHPDSIDEHIRRNNDTSSFIQPLDSLSFDKNVVNLDFQEYTIKADTANHTFTVYLGESEISPQLFLESYTIGYNNTGSKISNGMVVYSDSSYLSGFGNFKLATATDKDIVKAVTGVATHDIEPGTIGFATRFGNLTYPGHGFTIGAVLNLSDTSYGDIVDYEVVSPNYNVRIGRVLSDSVFQIYVTPFNSNDTHINLEGILNGIITKKQALRDTIISNILYFETYNEDDTTENLPYLSSRNRYLLNTLTNTGTNGYARVQLTYGSATTPTTNYIYIDNSGTPTLSVSTTAFPENGIRVAECGVFDQTTHETQGFAYMQRFNNSVDGSIANGWISRSAQRIRLNGSVWESGVNPTVSITTSAGLDSVQVNTTSGIIWQFNRQTFQARNEKKYLWVNSPTGMQWISDLAEIDVDANNVTLRGVNKRYGLNIFAIQNSGGYDDILAVTTPNGSYSSDNNAINDVNNYAVTSVPTMFGKTAVRLCRIVLNYTTGSGGTITNLLGAGEFQDERGQPLGTGGGGSGSGGPISDFSDADVTIYNSADPTKIIDFDVSGVSSGTTRTMVFPDSTGTLALKEYTASLDYLNSIVGDIDSIRVSISGDSTLFYIGSDTIMVGLLNPSSGSITNLGDTIYIYTGKIWGNEYEFGIANGAHTDSILIGYDGGAGTVIVSTFGVSVEAPYLAVNNIKNVASISNSNNDSIKIDASGNIEIQGNVNLTAGNEYQIDGVSIGSGGGGEDSLYYFAIALSDSSTELTTANGDSWDAMINYMIDSVRIGVNSPPTGSALSVDIKKNGTSIFSTLITIDAGDSTSVGATTPYALSTTSISYNDRMQSIASSVGATYGGAGLKVYIYGKKE